MANTKPRVKLPKTAAKGEIIRIKTLISHKMESGFRKDSKTGELVPRKIINKFECSFNGEPAFTADWHPAISANPYISFTYRAEESGTFGFQWTDDDGSVYSTEKTLTVS